MTFLVKMSFTIWASTGEQRFCSGTHFASLLSWAVLADVSRATSSELSSGQRVIPGSYSDSQTGQNIGPSGSSQINFVFVLRALYFVLCTLCFVLRGCCTSL